MTMLADLPTAAPDVAETPPASRPNRAATGAATGAVPVAATVLPVRPDVSRPGPRPRPIGKVSVRGVLAVAGAAVSALCITLLLFGRLAPLDGKLGFTVVLVTSFVCLYAAIVRLDDDRPAVVDRTMTTLLAISALVAVAALVSVIVFVLVRGRSALFKLNTYTEDMRFADSLAPLDVGGILHAIVGTLIIVGIAFVLSVPLAIACAVYLTESRGRLTELVRTVVTAMTALPSIVAGLFVFAVWVLLLGYPKSGTAAAIAISIMMMPIIVRSADVVLRLVPGSLREAAAALGAPQWRIVWHVVLPTAKSGLATSVILGIARGVGETAPVLLTAGFTQSLTLDPSRSPMMSLPLLAFEFVRSPQPAYVERGFATAAVLMLLVLVLFSIARLIGGKPAGQKSQRQLRRAGRRSERDLARIEGRPRELGRLLELTEDLS